MAVCFNKVPLIVSPLLWNFSIYSNTKVVFKINLYSILTFKTEIETTYIINRPGVAEAVLKTAL